MQADAVCTTQAIGVLLGVNNLESVLALVQVDQGAIGQKTSAFHLAFLYEDQMRLIKCMSCINYIKMVWFEYLIRRLRNSSNDMPRGGLERLVLGACQGDNFSIVQHIFSSFLWDPVPRHRHKLNYCALRSLGRGPNNVQGKKM